MKFLAELKRRNVLRAGVLYIGAVWALAQGIAQLAPLFGNYDWVARWFVVAAVVGFPFWLVFAWVYEFTPQGLKRDSELAPDAGLARSRGRRLDKWIIAVLALAVVLLVTDRLTSRPAASDQAPGATVSSSRPSIAVLPFADMSPAHDQAYFSDGLADELLNMLAQLPQLRVIARTSSFSFRGREVDVATIAHKLDVNHLLEGSVRKSGQSLRISVQLIRASDSAQIWSQTYDRKLTDIFKVQDEIAASVVGALKVRLLPDQRLHNPDRSDNTKAYDEYLLGREFQNRDTPDDWRRAAAAFQRAIDRDPAYGAPWAGLANAQYLLADLAGDPASKQHALDVANQAVTRAPGLADAWAARGTIRLAFFRDWNGAGEDFGKALDLNSGSAAVQLGRYRLSMALGRHRQALAAARQATTIDPLNSIAWSSLARIELVQGDAEAARQAAERAQAISPQSLIAGAGVGMAALAQGKPREALAAFRTAGDVYGPAGIAMAEYSLGHAHQSQQALDEAIHKYGAAGAYQIAQAYAWRGDTDQAFEWLDKAFAHNDGGLSFLKSDPVMAKLSRDPRYAKLLKKMGLPE